MMRLSKVLKLSPLLIGLAVVSCEEPKKVEENTEKEEHSDAAMNDEVAEETFQIAEGHVKVWNEAIKQMMELADAMPEEEYGFKPHDSSKTFAEQLTHIAMSSVVISNFFLKDVPPPSEKPDMDVNAMSKEEIKNLLSKNLTEVGELFASLSDDVLLNEEAKSFSGNTMSRLEGMMMVHDHLTNHKAKANLYVRISNHEPPKYRYY